MAELILPKTAGTLFGRARHALGALGMLALAVLPGCRHLDGAQVDVLERELRQQEDYIYELEDYLIEYSEKLRQTRMAECQPGAEATSPAKGVKPLREPTLDKDLPATRLPLDGRHKPTPPKTLAPSAATAVESAKPAAPAVSAPEAIPSGTPPAAAPPAAQPEAQPEQKLKPEEMEAPPLEIGTGASSLPWKKSGSVAKASPTLPPESATAPPLMIPDPVDYQVDAEPSIAKSAKSAKTAAAETASEPPAESPQAKAARLSAEKLHIRHIFRESSDPAQPIGSLMVVVEALNSTDEPADASGEASLMIMSNGGLGKLHRVDRWDFSPEETKAAWQSSQLGDGLHLELPLGEVKLPKGNLELWARLVCSDGRKLLAQVPFDPAQLASIEEGTEKAALASAEEPAALPIASAAVEKAEVAKAPPEKAPSWRSSAVRLDSSRVEGFATTAAGKQSNWSTQPGAASETRVAAASGSSSTSRSKPTWKLSSAPQAQGGSPKTWAPER